MRITSVPFSLFCAPQLLGHAIVQSLDKVGLKYSPPGHTKARSSLPGLVGLLQDPSNISSRPSQLQLQLCSFCIPPQLYPPSLWGVGAGGISEAREDSSSWLPECPRLHLLLICNPLSYPSFGPPFVILKTWTQKFLSAPLGVAQSPPAPRGLNGTGDRGATGRRPAPLFWAPEEALRLSTLLRGSARCPWGVRSPRGEFLRERRRLKIVALGSGPISLSLGPCRLPHAGLGEGCGPKGSPSWAVPVSSQTQPASFSLPVAPWTLGPKKRDQLGDFRASRHPGQRAEKPQALFC